jgi:hypothetical protein
MADDRPIVEPDTEEGSVDPDEIPIRDRKIFTQPYDLVVESLIEQIKGGTLFLRPLSERPQFQRRYVWNDRLASRLIESIILNVPVPPCFLSQNQDYELDVIDGQQRLFSIYRFFNNQFPLSELEVLSELNGCRYFELPSKIQRQIRTHTLRLVVITNESHPEIKFDVFERLNTNTVPLNAQELRNCVYRGALNDLLKDLVAEPEWLEILGRKAPDKRMRDEELVLRYISFLKRGVNTYRTPQKHWLNETAAMGRDFSSHEISTLQVEWTKAISICRIWFSPRECFRKLPQLRAGPINRALFDLVMLSASRINSDTAIGIADDFRSLYLDILNDAEFADLISRAVDHTSRTKRRFALWEERFGALMLHGKV